MNPVDKHEEGMPLIVNEVIRELELQLIAEVQKQVPKKIIHSMLMFKLEDGRCLIANLGEVSHE